jgi:hypothetical protein
VFSIAKTGESNRLKSPARHRLHLNQPRLTCGARAATWVVGGTDILVCLFVGTFD